MTVCARARAASCAQAAYHSVRLKEAAIADDVANDVKHRPPGPVGAATAQWGWRPRWVRSPHMWWGRRACLGTTTKGVAVVPRAQWHAQTRPGAGGCDAVEGLEAVGVAVVDAQPRDGRHVHAAHLPTAQAWHVSSGGAVWPGGEVTQSPGRHWASVCGGGAWSAPVRTPRHAPSRKPASVAAQDWRRRLARSGAPAWALPRRLPCAPQQPRTRTRRAPRRPVAFDP